MLGTCLPLSFQLLAHPRARETCPLWLSFQTTHPLLLLEQTRAYVCASPATPVLTEPLYQYLFFLSGVFGLPLRISKSFPLHCLLKRLPRAFLTCHFERLQGMLVYARPQMIGVYGNVRPCWFFIWFHFIFKFNYSSNNFMKVNVLKTPWTELFYYNFRNFVLNLH